MILEMKLLLRKKKKQERRKAGSKEGITEREGENDWLWEWIETPGVCYTFSKLSLAEDEWESTRLKLVIKTKFWYPCISFIKNTLIYLTLMVRVKKWMIALSTYISFILLCNRLPQTFLEQYVLSHSQDFGHSLTGSFAQDLPRLQI